MPNVFSKLQKETKPARNPFDLSHYDVYTAKFGVIRPVFCMETLPGDHIEIQPSNYLRTMQPLQTDAFVKATQNLDFYFVPFQQLFSAFPEFYAKVSDPQTYSDRNVSDFDSVPFFDVVELFITAAGASSDCRYFGIYVEDVELQDMLHSYPQLLQIYKQWFFGVIDLLDTLGYGNYFVTLQNLAWSYDVQDILDEQSFVLFIEYIRQDASNFRRLWSLNTRGDGSPEHIFVSAFRIMAYQRVWYNYYRNHYYDIDNDAYVYMINADYFNSDDGQLNVLDELPYEAIIELFSVRYRQWKKDLLTGLLPSAQFGDVAVASLNGDALVDGTLFGANSALNGASFDDINQDTNGRINGHISDDTELYSRFFVHTTAKTSSVGVSVLQIRTAEALQRWKENTLRAGVKTTNQFKAHFGVEPRYVRDWYPDFLGSVDGAVNITSVTSQSETGQAGNGKLGDVAGNITSSLSKKTIKFDAQDFGVIIGCYSILPDAQYNSFGIDEHNVHLTADDFYIPEFQNVGLAPVYARNIDMVTGQYGPADRVLGYAPRYIEYKYVQSKVHGLLFGRSRIFCVNADDKSPKGYYSYTGQFNNWVIPRINAASVNGNYDYDSDVNRFYVHPDVMNSVFYAADDGTPASDQLILAFNFDVKAVRPISVIGLPQF